MYYWSVSASQDGCELTAELLVILYIFSEGHTTHLIRGYLAEMTGISGSEALEPL